MKIFKCGKYELDVSKKTYVMGILNVTPDSFSDGGKWRDAKDAIERAVEMKNQGADIIDIGGQSTRPGCVKISPEEEFDRIYKVIYTLTNHLDIPLSIDTFYPGVALESLKLGATIINDVNGFGKEMLEVVSGYNCGMIVMHNNQGKDIKSFFQNKIVEAASFGIEKQRLCFDPGIGFSKGYEENLSIFKNFDKLCVEDCAMLIAASRKTCIGEACNIPTASDRDEGTIAAHTAAILNGANIIRVHNVEKAVQAAKMIDAIIRGK